MTASWPAGGGVRDERGKHRGQGHGFRDYSDDSEVATEFSPAWGPPVAPTSFRLPSVAFVEVSEGSASIWGAAFREGRGLFARGPRIDSGSLGSVNDAPGQEDVWAGLGSK